MYIKEFEGAEEEEEVVVVKSGGQEVDSISCGEKDSFSLGSDGERGSVVVSTKRVLIGAGARALFYPTLLYNVVRNKFQTEFRWWDRVDEFVLLGAVPFPTDVPRLKEVGVGGVVTLNESYETLVPSSLYHDHNIDHLVIPTRDYCFAPAFIDICRAVDFIHENAMSRQTTYVHCKAGRGRSTTIVICYLVQHKQMTPDDAYDYVKSIRPRVLLASAQWKAVQEYYHVRVNKGRMYSQMADQIFRVPRSMITQDVVKFDDGSVVFVTKSDLEGYESSLVPSTGGSDIWADLSVVYRVRVAGQAALTRISCLWFRYGTTEQKTQGNKLGRLSSCSFSADHLGGINVDIHVY